LGPAKYLPSTTEPAIRALESTTRMGADHARGLSVGKVQYLRSTELIGWDEGKDATWSYVECSGGAGSRR
jgi:hypothetical protein